MPTQMATKESVLAGLEPRAFWDHFEALTRIARPSRHEEPVIEHVREWADRHGFELKQDAGRNLVIRVPASPGREAAPTVVLQGHLDMVCERDPSSPNDAAEGRIALVRDGDWLTADGTTLGADDGVAIAAMMALVEDESLPHGPLELLMTVAEEVGLEGANALDGSLLTGSILINLDSEEDGRLTVGCAGSTDTWVRVDAPREPAAGDATTLSVSVTGGRGGHSGTGIALGASNAIKVLGRALREALDDRAVPARVGRRRQEPQRDPARRGSDRLRRERRRAGVSRGARERGGHDPRRVREDGCQRSRSTSPQPTRRRTRGRRRAPRRCSTRSRSSRRDRSRSAPTSMTSWRRAPRSARRPPRATGSRCTAFRAPRTTRRCRR